jgi:hypothetical protein
MRTLRKAPITLLLHLRLRLRSALSRFRIVAVVTTLISALACGDTPARPTKEFYVSSYRRDGRIAGRVLDYATNLGVSNATVGFAARVNPRPPPPPITTTTDAAGSYVLALPRGIYSVEIQGAIVGGPVNVTGDGSRGDVFVNGGACDARYGVITDFWTGLPIAGARVSFGPVTSGSDGWYHIEYGCPRSFDFGTQGIYFEHPEYADVSRIIGAGKGVSRLDVAMVRRGARSPF